MMKTLNKTIALFLAFTLSMALLAGCSSNEDTTERKDDNDTQIGTEEGDGKGEKYRICFLVNGNLGDSGFYDSAAEGVRRLEKEDNCEIKIIEMGLDETQYETYFRDVSEQGWDLIIAATWSVRETFETVAADYPDQKYLFLDGQISAPNMIGISYKANETGFMAGCLAAEMLSSGDPKIDPSNKTLGVVASIDSPNLNDFVVGYIEGSKYVDPEIRVICSYVNSFEDVATCLEMCTQVYNQGAQIIYAPTSQSMSGAVNASSNVDKYLILCDTDVYTSMADSDSEIVRNLISSSLKKIGDSIIVAVHGIWDNTREFGQNYCLGLKDGTVGLANNKNYQKIVPESIRKDMEEIENKVINGEIEIASALEMDAAEVAELRDSMKP